MDERLSTFMAQLQPLALAAIPPTLRRGRCHVVWRPELRRDNKIGKAPYSPRGFRASATNPRSWGTFAEAVQAYQRGGYAGIGYVLVGGVLFVDLDHCREPVTGALTPTAQALIERLASYAEASPTGTGVHIYLAGEQELPAHRYRFQDLQIEVYQERRYTTLTGQRLPGTPLDLMPHTDRLATLIAEWQPRQERTAPPAGELTSPLTSPGRDPAPHTTERRVRRPRPGPALSDEEVLEKAMRARNGSTFKLLWDGGDPRGRNNKSDADFDLVLLLLYWTNDDVEQTARLFRRSARHDAKTDRSTTRAGHTYLELTIYNALRYRREL
jgi:putative DNA primase/helicase